MKVTFRIRFATKPGQILRIAGSIAALGGAQKEKSLRMHYVDQRYWTLDIWIPEHELNAGTPIVYRYILEQEGNDWVEEWEAGRKIDPVFFGLDEIRLIDTWSHAGDVYHVFETSPFKKVLLSQTCVDSYPTTDLNDRTHRFIAYCPLLSPGEELCLTGSDHRMGNWNKSNGCAMHRVGDQWMTELDLSEAAWPITYKYAVRDSSTKTIIRYESGENRVIGLDEVCKDGCCQLNDGAARFSYDSWRGAGIAIPVFSLRSRQSFGVGEFTDISKLVAWAKITGLRMIQLLPVNDTHVTGTWVDSYPYSAISAFALHPLYLNLEEAAGDAHSHLLVGYAEERARLNALQDVDYEAVMRYKLDKISLLYNTASKSVFDSDEYKAFYRDNEYWLAPYAAFCYLRDKYGSPYPADWESDATYDAGNVSKLCRPGSQTFKKTGLYLFTQYLLHRQLSHAHDEANREGIILKGDIPIGVNRHGVEAWMEPGLFDLSMQAGAPPDDFAIKGQNWGFPTYQWPSMEQDGYGWWKRRFTQMSRYFDAFRIDHILGFFRIWSIPLDSVEGIMGRFVPAIPVDLHEFAERGIQFDISRFCDPYITDTVLWEMFGQDVTLFSPFLKELGEGRYRLLEEVATQRKVQGVIKGDDIQSIRIRQGLFDLISNVLMFEEPASQGNAFHFRFNIHQTLSFKHLEESEKDAVRALYVDYFFHRQDLAWKRAAFRKLPALKKCTDMLICGEDLGLVPGCVPEVMTELGILSMEVQRMPKKTGQEFFNPSHAPYLSVVTPSSHDMSTIRGWWNEDQERNQRFFLHELGQYAHPPADCEPWIVRNIIRQHLSAPAMWAVFQIQDLLAMSVDLRQADAASERINEPSNPTHYWRYRMPLSLEELMTSYAFNEMLSDMLLDSARKH
jgi:4-alpha-glucanotransferase